jgi:hypothetical protein
MNRYHRRCCRSPRWSAFMAGTVLPRALDPGTLPGRLETAGFTRVAVDADERLVRFAAYAPGAEAEAQPGAAA